MAELRESLARAKAQRGGGMMVGEMRREKERVELLLKESEVGYTA